MTDKARMIEAKLNKDKMLTDKMPMDKLLMVRRAVAASVACGWISLAPAAQADPPPARASAAAPNAKSLGITESVLKFCGPIDSKSAKKLQDKVTELTKGTSEEVIAHTRETAEYRRAYESMSAFAAKIDERNAKILCSDQTMDGK